MIVDLAVDRILNFHIEFLALQHGNKGNPLSPAAFFFACLHLTAPLFLGWPIKVTGFAVTSIKIHISILSLGVESNKAIDIRYLETFSELLTGKDNHAAQLGP